MGFVHVPVTLRATQKSRRKFEDQFLVDTGAIDCMAPASALKRIGIEPVGNRTYELADGSTTDYDFGLTTIEFMGTITSGRVIFGPEGCEPLLGVTALESVGAVVDPVTQRLKMLPTLRLKVTRRQAQKRKPGP